MTNPIISPIINEKTMALATLNQYVFMVEKGANKIEIKHAIEKIIKEFYPKAKSKVVKVNTLPMRGRNRASKRSSRLPKDGKKAIVWIEGDPLEMFTA